MNSPFTYRMHPPQSGNQSWRMLRPGWVHTWVSTLSPYLCVCVGRPLLNYFPQRCILKSCETSLSSIVSMNVSYHLQTATHNKHAWPYTSDVSSGALFLAHLNNHVVCSCIHSGHPSAANTSVMQSIADAAMYYWKILFCACCKRYMCVSYRVYGVVGWTTEATLCGQWTEGLRMCLMF